MLLHWLPEARAELQALPKEVAKRIVAKMDWYIAQDNPLHFAKTLKDFPPASHRFRVGDYRVLCKIHHGTMTVLIVLGVKNRKDAY